MRETRYDKTRRRRYYLKVLGIIVTVLIALNILLSGTALAKTITVDAGGSGDYTSIQDAIDNSIEHEEYGSEIYEYYPSNLTIIVYPGVYHESVKALFPLKLIAYSSNPSDTVIESEGYAITLQISDSYYGEYEYLISGFTINGADAGIYDSMQYASSLTIENNVITGGHNGIILSTEMPTIRNNKFSNNECGISLDDSGPVNITGNEFVNNNKGLSIVYSNADIKNNIFTNNSRAIDALGCGIKITHNVIRDNTEGISLSVCGRTTIASNVITGNMYFGVNCHLNSGDTIYNNNFNNDVNIMMIPEYAVLNIEACEGPNIVGGPYIGGNFWGKPDSTGFSQTCPDTDLDGFCDEPYIVYADDFFEAVDYLPLKEKVSPLEPVLPVANFSSNVTSGFAPLSVQFTDLSTNATEWNWNFGDGSYSTEQNPTHTYSKNGEYTVNLIVSNINGTSSTTNMIECISAVSVSLSSDPQPPFRPSETIFVTAEVYPALPGAYVELQSELDGWFAEGYTDASGKFTGVYTIPDNALEQVKYTSNPGGFYLSALANGIQSMDYYCRVSEQPAFPVVDLSASPITGKASLTVTFADKSMGSPTSWSWNFGDKSTSTDQNPVHAYKKAGKYTVSLTVKNALGSNTKKITNYIVVTNK